MPSMGSWADSIWPGKDSVSLRSTETSKSGGKGRGEQEEKILMEQNTQKLWYISQGISITAVPGGKKKRKTTYLKGY